MNKEKIGKYIKFLREKNNLIGGNDNFILEKSVMFVSKEKFFISIPKVSSINSDEINYKKVYYLDNKNEKHLIFEGNGDVIDYSENNGYNESINFKKLDNIINNLYIDIYYEDNIDTVKINLFLTYSNDNLFTKKIKSIS